VPLLCWCSSPKFSSRLVVAKSDYSTISVGEDLIGFGTAANIDCSVEIPDMYFNPMRPLLAAVLVWPTIMVTPSPVVDGYVYNFSGCGYAPNSAVYFYAEEEKENYQEFFYGSPTASDGCFVTPDAVWVWGAGVYDLEVLQKRGRGLRVVARTKVLVVQ
jgi:hypothetical protein